MTHNYRNQQQKQLVIINESRKSWGMIVYNPIKKIMEIWMRGIKRSKIWNSFKPIRNRTLLKKIQLAHCPPYWSLTKSNNLTKIDQTLTTWFYFHRRAGIKRLLNWTRTAIQTRYYTKRTTLLLMRLLKYHHFHKYLETQIWEIKTIL